MYANIMKFIYNNVNKNNTNNITYNLLTLY